MCHFKCYCEALVALHTQRKQLKPTCNEVSHLCACIRVPHNFLEYFASQAVENGIDIIRVFDGLNDVANLTVAIDACLRAGAVVEAAILYTGDMLDPDCKYSLNYYIDLIDSLVATGAHIIAIKSMSGVMKPEAARLLVGAIRSRHPFLPIHVHTHDAAGMCTL